MNDEVHQLVFEHLLRVHVGDEEADVVTLWTAVRTLTQIHKTVLKHSMIYSWAKLAKSIIIITDNVCIALFSGVSKLTAE